MAEQTLANGVRASHTYNSLGQMTNLLHIRPGGEVFGAYTATYDRVGNRIQVDEVEGTYYYGYDRTHQLTSEQRTGSYAYAYSYVYDPVGNRLLMDQGNGNVVSYTYDLGDQLLATSPAGPDEALCVFEQVVAPPLSRDALALRYTMHETELLVEQASLAVVGAAGTWDASNHWLFTLQVRDESLAPVRTLATATYQQAGAGVVRLTVPALEQAVDGTASPELTVKVETIGSPGNLLAVAGSATVWEDVGGAWGRAGDGAFPALLPAPYHQDALPLTLPLSAGHTYEVVSATVGVVGATGTWDASNHWLLSLESRSASLGLDTVLATATFDTGGQASVALTSPSPVTVDADTTPVLAIAFQRVGNPGLLLRANATVAFAGAGEAGITSITYDENGNTRSEAGPSGTTTYTWNAEDRLVAVASAGGIETYTYAADGLRRRKVTAAGTTQFVWDGQNLLAEVGGGLQTQAQQTDFPGVLGRAGEPAGGGESAFYAFDMSGNTRRQTDATASVEAEQTFSAFGSELAALLEAIAFGGRVGYQPDTSDRNYVRARHYVPSRGLWLSRDPLLRRAFVRDHRYARNNPVRFVDPSGLVSCDSDSIADWWGRMWNPLVKPPKDAVMPQLSRSLPGMGTTDYYTICRRVDVMRQVRAHTRWCLSKRPNDWGLQGLDMIIDNVWRDYHLGQLERECGQEYQQPGADDYLRPHEAEDENWYQPSWRADEYPNLPPLMNITPVEVIEAAVGATSEITIQDIASWLSDWSACMGRCLDVWNPSGTVARGAVAVTLAPIVKHGGGGTPLTSPFSHLAGKLWKLVKHKPKMHMACPRKTDPLVMGVLGA